MKKYFYVVILIVLSQGCDSNPTSSPTDEPEIPVTMENLTGTWNWIQSIDSTNQLIDQPSSGNTRSLIITQERTFKEYRNDTLIFSDTFSLFKALTPYATDSLSIIDWDHAKYFNYIVFSLTSKNLVIGRFGNYKSVFTRRIN